MKRLNEYLISQIIEKENEEEITEAKDVYDDLQDIKDWAEKYGAEQCVENLCSIFEDILDDKTINDIAQELWEYES